MRHDIKQCIEQVSRLVKGKESQIELSLICIISNGHLLLEDLPGMGKTTLSHALAKIFGLEYARIQFTSDLLPADMLGVNIFNQKDNSFEFHPGPVFNQLILADEINRASPKTQSALLEAMAERQVTIDGVTHTLPSPFFVIASQNPLHQSGTHPLPESQLDRFQMQLSLGYPNAEAEKAMLMNNSSVDEIDTVMSVDELQEMQRKVSQVMMSDSVVNYLLALVNHTRTSNDFPNALSPRASKALFSAAQAAAFVNRRDFVTPEDIQFILPSVAEHRLRGQLLNSTGSSYSEHLLQQVDPLAA
ncbi:AAA family ATPase [Glaciecola sp. 1036]|uniref:AAA family ATPase n=1 Tax=Alteromonadaceae TaxID=72275 RepID=UPI003CFD9DA5